MSNVHANSGEGSPLSVKKGLESDSTDRSAPSNKNVFGLPELHEQPSSSSTAPCVQVSDGSLLTRPETQNHFSSKQSQNGSKDEHPEPEWQQIRWFITSKRDYHWNSVYKLVTLSPEDFTDREKDLREQATHLVYSSKAKQFKCIWNELKIEEDLDTVLKSIDKMISAEEASSARGDMIAIHEDISTDVHRVCEAMMRGTFFRNNGSVVFHIRLFWNYLNGQPEQVDKME